MSLFCFACQRALNMPGRIAFCPYCGEPVGTVGPSAPDRSTAHSKPSTSGRSVPEVVGDYRLLRRLGEGGMGAVYEGEHKSTGRRVAVKLIDVEADASALERFRQEGKLASALSHPRCVFVLAADQDAGRPFLVLELMPGRTLADHVEQRGPLPLDEALSHALDLIEGLEQVHALGVIHRDVKPSNCFLDHEGRIKVGDFGLARLLRGDGRLTQTGTFVGTPLYASPEQIKSQPLDARADVYSVCATLFFLLTGRAPYDEPGRDALAVMATAITEDAPPIRSLRKDVLLGLELLLARGLARHRDRRPADLAALRGELEAFRPDLPWGWLVVARLVAYNLDMLLLAPLGYAIANARGQNPLLALPDPLTLVIIWLIHVSYFAAMEGLLGTTVGKWLFGLRVRLRGDVIPPGWWRSVLRTAMYFALTDPIVVSLFNALQGLAAPVYLGLSYAGLIALLVTMRKSNGFAMLHDLLSGTSVVAPGWVSRAPRYLSRPLPKAADPSTERIGPFHIVGEAWCQGEERVLRGIDPNLDRQVLLWQRPADRPQVSQERRESTHVGRPRWLSGGEVQGKRWDAFLAPAGAPVTEAIAAAGKRDWEQARRILRDLAVELLRDRQARFHLEQVWLTPEGYIVLIDLPLNGDDPPTQEDLLALVAVVLLEGKPINTNRPPRAVLPIHARQMLRGLPRFGGTMHVPAFREQLKKKNHPARLSWRLRLLHLGMLLLSPVCLSAMMTVFFTILVAPVCTGILLNRVTDGKTALARHDQVRAVLVVPVIVSDSTPLHRLLTSLLLHRYESAEDRDALEREIAQADNHAQTRHERLSAVSRVLAEEYARRLTLDPGNAPQDEIRMWLASGAWNPQLKSIRTLQRETQWLGDRPSSGLGVLWSHVYPGVLYAAGVCVLLAGLTRRGLRSMIVGIDMVRSDGAPAGRLRCAWRALMAWLPWVGVVMLASWAEESAWQAWTRESGHTWLLALADVAWVAFYALPLTLLALALRTPSRALHDRLAGTHLVPR